MCVCVHMYTSMFAGIPYTSAIISSDIMNDINEFIPWLEEEEVTVFGADMEVPYVDNGPSAETTSSSGELAATRWNLLLTIVGFIFYLFDLASDIGTSVYYAINGQWWQAAVTLTIVYGAVIMHAVMKWQAENIHCTGAAAWLRYVASSLVNWPDLELYGALCRVEWQLCKSPARSAHLVPEWHEKRVNVARLKFMEGVCEACPQAILQLYLLLPDLYGARTWTDYLRTAGACVSLCTAGAALVNWEKCTRIINYTDLPLSELVVLHVWAVPVTVSRLLYLALLLSVHLYWGLAGVALHLVLYGVYLCSTVGVSRTLRNVIAISLDTLQFCMSPLLVAGSVTVRRVFHTVHFLVNTAMMVVWALGTPLVYAHPALYTTIICFNAAMMTVGLVGMELHNKYWSERYPST